MPTLVRFSGRQCSSSWYYLVLVAQWLFTAVWILVFYWVVFVWKPRDWVGIVVGVLLAGLVPDPRELFRSHSAHLKEHMRSNEHGGDTGEAD